MNKTKKKISNVKYALFTAVISAILAAVAITVYVVNYGQPSPTEISYKDNQKISILKNKENYENA